MKACVQPKTALLLSVAAVFLLVPSVWGRSHHKPLFKYVAGTESLPGGCEGKLEVTEKALVFQCSDTSLSVPYHSITYMEYRRRVSKQIRKMKLNWAIKPSSRHSRHLGFFAVLYADKGQPHAMILKVPDKTMRPYLAEIDLRTGHAIQGGLN